MTTTLQVGTYAPDQTRFIIEFGSGPDSTRVGERSAAEMVAGVDLTDAAAYAREQLGKTMTQFWLDNPTADQLDAPTESDTEVITGYTVVKYNDVDGTDETWSINGVLKAR